MTDSRVVAFASAPRNKSSGVQRRVIFKVIGSPVRVYPVGRKNTSWVNTPFILTLKQRFNARLEQVRNMQSDESEQWAVFNVKGDTMGLPLADLHRYSQMKRVTLEDK